jgi:hypothetical protein
MLIHISGWFERFVTLLCVWVLDCPYSSATLTFIFRHGL